MLARGIAVTALVLGLALGAIDTAPTELQRPVRAGRPPPMPATACAGRRAPLPNALSIYHLGAAAFPGSDQADVAVHIPVGFNATRRPGLVIYFHGWQGCVGAVLGANDIPCEDGGSPRSGSDLAAQLDAAHVNAILIAVELRVDAATGEPGQLAMPSGARDLLQEVFAHSLSEPIGCTLQVEALDRIVVIAHSGGYQAAASLIAWGDLPQVSEVDLLDALYGAEDVFARWIADDVDRFDSRLESGLRFVDLYTCCGGTLEPSRSFARATKEALFKEGREGAMADEDGDRELDRSALERPILFKRVPRLHGELPRAYVRALLEAAGFAPIRASLP